MSDDSRLSVASVRFEEDVPSVEHVKAIRSDLGTPALAAGPGGGTPAPQSPFAYLRMVHNALRGRYWWLIPLSLLCGAAAGAVAFKLHRPKYHSEGLLRIAYTLPEVMGETDQNKPLAMFETFMQSQRMLITSRRVIDMAIQDPVWKATGRQVPAKPDEYFANNLKVDIKPRSEFILITVTDEDPGTAAAAVGSIVNAYTDFYRSQDAQLERQRSGVLEDKQSNLGSRILSLNNDIKARSQEFGTSKLEMFYEVAAARVTKLESALVDVRTAIALAPADKMPLPDGEKRAQPVPREAVDGSKGSLTPEQIAKSDPVMRDYLKAESAASAELRRLRNARLGPVHPTMLAAQQAFEDAQRRVREYAETSREYNATTAQVLGDLSSGPVLTAGKSVSDLRTNEASLVKLHRAAKEEMVALGNKRLELQRLESEVDTLKDELEGLNRRIEILRAEGSIGGRLNVISTGEIPLSPDRDRRLPLAAAAGAAGMSMPVGLLLLLSFAKRKYRFSDDAHGDVSTNFPLLGVLPELQESADVEQMAAAAHNVHQIRVSLQSRAAHNTSSVYLVSSATAGEGKTSLAMSLALSFAASGLRTLVIDCDMVGQRLTENLQAGELDGLSEALAAGTLKRAIRKTKQGVFVLTAGKGAAGHGYALPTAGLAALLAEARKYFPAVLVDSGPILGSVEAAAVAREVDGVVFAISRGQDHGLVVKAVRRLESVGGRLSGCVFNRASRSDFARLPYGSSWSSTPATVNEASTQRLERFGPLVRAVAGTLPNTHN